MKDKDEKDVDESDVVAEDLDDSVVVEEHAHDRVNKLKEKLKAAEEKAKEYLDSWQRDKADFLNLRKRDEADKQEFAKFAVSGLVYDLLPVLDSFNLALQHPDSKAELATGQVGVEPIYRQLMSILKTHGLEEISALGETFDPRSHEAIGVIPTEKPEDDHKILEVIQKGYIISGKILRPAKVRTGEYKENL